MKTLKDRILKDGKCYPGGILKVDNFINHQMDPILMKSIGVEFVRRFASTSINKIITVEASGIAPAIMVGYLLELPVVFAKKKKPSTMENMLVTSVYSFTKQRSYDVCVSKDSSRPATRCFSSTTSLPTERCQRHHGPGEAGWRGTGGHGIHHRESLPAWW